jgi:hypothetical protein
MKMVLKLEDVNEGTRVKLKFEIAKETVNRE